jgi:hypothetical protein
MRTMNELILVVAAAGCSTASFQGHDGGGDLDAQAQEIDAPGSMPGPTDARTDAPTDASSQLPPQTSRLRIISRCSQPIWIAHSNNVPNEQNERLATGDYHDYAIPTGGLSSARFWPKVGCDTSGHNCRIGDSGEGGGAPCGPTGCQPPIDSKFEVTFAAIGSSQASFYNLSLVDGFTLPFAVAPVGAGSGAGSCTASDCSMLALDACPTAEDLGGTQYPQYADRNLRVSDVGCMSPCKAWRYPQPYGLNLPESQDPGLHLCCPTPIDPGTGNCTIANGCMTAAACRSQSDPLGVVHTQFVQLVHARCPTAYAYAYDDAAGLHACSANTGFVVTFCP